MPDRRGDDAVSIPRHVVEAAAKATGVCARPVISRVTDLESGEVQNVAMPCGSTREDRCPSCADRARRLRIQQCREGWHLDTEPEYEAVLPAPVGEDGDEGDEDDEDQGDENEAPRRVRSTRRRRDVPDLPRLPMEDRTVGRVFTAPDGKTYRPSMFLTLTLPSYGRVTAEGVPVDPDSYDYRRAALDALHFPKLVDRFWQNLRRCAGYDVQYFATIEAQRRLAPHFHAAIRGTIPRTVVRQVRAATYHQLWWPEHDVPVHTKHLPRWSPDQGGYIDSTGWLLPTWEEALAAYEGDLDAEPAHALQFGDQDDLQGLLAGTPDTDRRVGYLCKYLTKDIATTYDDGDPSPARQAHIDRLAEEVRWLPCSPTCANWLRYDVQPKDAEPGMVPGHCKHKAHDRANLGIGGRRVLVSRKWSGKTLAAHKADRAAVVRAALEEAGIDPDDHDELAITGSDGRWSWEVLGRSRVDEATYLAAIAQAIATRERWKAQYEMAKSAWPGPAPPTCGGVSSTGRSDNYSEGRQ
jgi:Replication initiator protein, pSAM2